MFRFLLLLFFLSHCQPQQNSKDTLFVALDAEVQNLDPRSSTSANGMRIINLLFTSLVKIGPQLETLPEAANNWKQESLSYIFNIKKLKFSNGREVSKEDLLFSFQEFQKKSSPFYSAFKNIKSVQVLKTKTGFRLTLQMKQYSATFLSSDLPIIKILPKKEILELKKNPFSSHPLGTGDFKLVHKNAREILLERVRPQPQLPKYISFQIIRDGFTMTQKMIMGKIDIAPSVIPLDKIYHFKNKKFQVLSQPSTSTTYLLLNLKNKLLKQKQVRKALSLSLNREEIIKYKLKGYGLKAQSLIHNKNPFFYNLAKTTHDLTQAKTILQNLNLKNSSLAGKTSVAEHPTLTLKVSNRASSISKARILASQISRTGLSLSIKSYEWGTFYKDINDGRYDLALMKWVGVTDPDIYRVAFHSDNQAPKGRNRSFYSDKKLDALLEKALREPNFKLRKSMYNLVQKKIAEEIAIIPLWHDKEVHIIKSNIKNYQVPLNGDFSFLKTATKE